MQQQETEYDIAALVKAVDEATVRHKDAVSRAREASREETATLNRLNDAQRNLDTAIAARRKAAPSDTEWHRAAHRREGISGPGLGGISVA